MSDVTRILESIDSGDPNAAEELLPLVYAELRRLAAARMANEKSGQTLQATALVHEGWLRLAGDQQRIRNPHVFKASVNGGSFLSARRNLWKANPTIAWTLVFG